MTWLSLLVALCPGCTCDGADSVADAGAGQVGLEPAPAPSGLVLTGAAPRPEELWQKLRIAIGGPVFFVPKTFGGAAVALLGLPLAAGPEFDADVPAVFAARLDERGALQFVAGLHVKAGDRLANQLTVGQTPPFSVQEDAASHVTLLVRSTTGKSDALSLGVHGNYLLVGGSAEDLRALGPYVTRTLPSQPMPTEDLAGRIPESALRGPVVETIRARLDQLASLPVPLSAVAFKALVLELSRDGLKVLGGLGSVEAKLVIDARAARITLRAPLLEQDSAARRLATELSPGDPGALRELPSHTLAAVWARQPRDARVLSAKESAELLVSALGSELTDEQGKDVRAALEGIAAARGDEFVAGAGVGPFGPAAHAITSGGDEAVLDEAVQRLLGLVELSPVRERLANASLEAQVKATTVERLPGDVVRLRFSRAKPAKGEASPSALGLPEKVDVLVHRRGARLYVAAGLDGPEALRSLTLAPKGERLGEVASFGAAIDDLQEGIVATLMFDITGIADRLHGKRPGAPPSVVAMSFGVEPKERSSLWMRADVARPAIGDLVRWLDAL